MTGGILGWIDLLPRIAVGVAPALQLTMMTLAIGYPIGVLLSVLTASPVRTIRLVSMAIVEIGRGLPLLVLLLLIYRGLPETGWVIDPMPSAVIAFSWSTGAYAAEMIRASFGAIPPGQREAAQALGFSDGRMFWTVLAPQAARIALPPLTNLMIVTFQVTSLAYAISLPEIMQQAYLTASTTFRYMEAYTAAAVIYAALTLPAIWLVRVWERRLGRHLAL